VTADASRFITVAVCTRDRPERLLAFLNSAKDLVVPPGLRWELIIVDNGTNDASDKVVEKFASSLPIRRVEEPVPGISPARNRAVREARGDYICWSDDDTILDHNWLAAYAAAFARHPEAAIFGGKILRNLEEPVPRWVRKSLGCWQLDAVFVHRDIDRAKEVGVSRDVTPWGANFAVRTVEQRQFEYDVELGMSPKHNRSGEESDLLYRMLAGGCKGWWVPESIVHHAVPRSRQTWSYLHFYFVRAAETAAYAGTRFADQDGTGKTMRRLSLMSSRRLYSLMVLHWILFLAANAAGLFRHSVRSLARAGFYRGVLNSRKGDTQCRSSRSATETIQAVG